jgi:hypothetical protein
LYSTVKRLADQADLVSIVIYFEACKASEKGRRVREKLEAEGKKSLETEERRFVVIARRRAIRTGPPGRPHLHHELPRSSP